MLASLHPVTVPRRLVFTLLEDSSGVTCDTRRFQLAVTLAVTLAPHAVSVPEHGASEHHQPTVIFTRRVEDSSSKRLA